MSRIEQRTSYSRHLALPGAETIATEKHIENSQRASILNSVAHIAQIKVTPEQADILVNRMLAIKAPCERGVGAYDIVVTDAAPEYVSDKEFASRQVDGRPFRSAPLAAAACGCCICLGHER